MRGVLLFLVTLELWLLSYFASAQVMPVLASAINGTRRSTTCSMTS